MRHRRRFFSRFLSAFLIAAFTSPPPALGLRPQPARAGLEERLGQGVPFDRAGLEEPEEDYDDYLSDDAGTGEKGTDQFFYRPWLDKQFERFSAQDQAVLRAATKQLVGQLIHEGRPFENTLLYGLPNLLRALAERHPEDLTQARERFLRGLHRIGAEVRRWKLDPHDAGLLDQGLTVADSISPTLEEFERNTEILAGLIGRLRGQEDPLNRALAFYGDLQEDLQAKGLRARTPEQFALQMDLLYRYATDPSLRRLEEKAARDWFTQYAAGLEEHRVESARVRVQSVLSAFLSDRTLHWQVAGLSLESRYPALKVLDHYLQHFLVDPGGVGTEVLAYTLAHQQVPADAVTYYGSAIEEKSFHAALDQAFREKGLPPIRIFFVNAEVSSLQAFLVQSLAQLTGRTEVEIRDVAEESGLSLQKLSEDLELLAGA